ncbi:P-loop containing nucleoside triphosphate hydrolase protein [Chaetomium strumarium]|uniref:P-loop containing nucleoside triphosphate hydrolase protein n=1 Tax=Chaetomium strumarium TaxID=1170767 RepID=A0AAJ0GKS1_9PEZI|nr:P-loop containing nucleoside triphosphate hydrolase protein [Chaetomium strumarium]
MGHEGMIHLVSSASDGIFLLYLPFRCWELHNSRHRHLTGALGHCKLSVGLVLSAYLFLRLFSLQLGPLLLLSLAASLIAALGLNLLMYLEQRRANKPSDLAILYLLASVACDLVALTVPSAVRRPPPARWLLHTLLLVLESFESPVNQAWTPRKSQAPEDNSSILSRLFFAWINPVVLRGYRSLLLSDDSPPLPRDLDAKLSKQGMVESWNRRARPETKLALPLALFRCIRRAFVAPIVPRLLLMLFRYSQPALIRQSIQFVTDGIPTAAGVETRGYWLVLSAVTIYIGLAVSTAAYQHRLNRLRVVTKSALVGIIHHKTIELPSATHDNDNSEAITLMSNDAEGLDGVAEMVHETWAQILEVVIGIVLLSREVGWIWPLPLILIFLCSRMSRYVAKHLGPRQKAWNTATQQRVAATSSMLGAMKVIKTLGLQRCMARFIRRLRDDELATASKVRWIMVYYNAGANMLGIFSPAITLTLFAVAAARRGLALKPETAFTTIAILSMVTHPANMVMTIIPRAVAAFAGFQRIQAYLLRPRLVDERRNLPSSGEKFDSAIEVQDVAVGEDPSILEGVSIGVNYGSLIILSGSVGSGKSTLLRAILGEIRPVRGSIQVAQRRIAYCSQKPWLPNGSIKQAICGIMDGEQGDTQWYRRVLEACCLNHDLDLLPDGDETQIGSGGVNLSGGQRQRVALARTLFSRCDIALLDDVFSALDGDTETKIFRNLFGRRGVFRQLNTAILLVTNSAQFFPTADRIVILSGGSITTQGPWEAIRHKAHSSISKFNVQHQTDRVVDPASLSNSSKLNAQPQIREEAQADLARKTGDLRLYWYYFRFVRLVNLALLAGCTASYSFFITFPQQWLKLWTKSSNQNQVFYVFGFILLSLISWTSTNGTMWSAMIRIAPHSGQMIHQHLLTIVSNAPLSFFSNNDNGSILTRFTQDMQLIDKQLPSALANLGTQVFKLLAQVLLLSMAQKRLALSLPVCGSLVWIIQKVYLRTSRQLRFLELESRAAVLSSFLESVEGLETIRSLGWLSETADQNTKRLGDSQRPEYLLMCLQRWLNLVLDLIAATVAVGIIWAAVAFRGQIQAGQVGVALNVVLVANTTLLRLIESWTGLEVSLGAIARLQALKATTPSELIDKKAIFEPPRGWPTQGRVEFKGVTAGYSAEAVALRNLTLTISAGQKITICGRTGSGKSSVLLALLRMLDVQSGRIEIDGVNITQIPREFLRQRCFVAVSQDGFLLPSESLRFNLDPECLLGNDQIIIGTLTRVGLWSHFLGNSKEHGGGDGHPILDQKLSSFSAFSAGQSQLFTLCRGIFKAEALRADGGRPVVLLDEVTSALDSTTERAVQRIIEDELSAKGHTTIMVSHRISQLSECMRPGRDVVVRMRDGKLEGIVSDLKGAAGEILGS